VIDDLLDELFTDLAAIALEGAKSVGKTATGTPRADGALARPPRPAGDCPGDIDYVTRVEAPVLVDEWQLVPSEWDRIRAPSMTTLPVAGFC
jgi:hypothetical protein